jgi:hypothetical protein
LETGVADAAEEHAEASEGAGGTGRLALWFLGAGVLGRRLVRSPRGSPAFRRRLLAPAAGGVAVVVVVVEDSIAFVWYWVGFGGGILYFCAGAAEREEEKKSLAREDWRRRWDICVRALGN